MLWVYLNIPPDPFDIPEKLSLNHIFRLRSTERQADYSETARDSFSAQQFLSSTIAMFPILLQLRAKPLSLRLSQWMKLIALLLADTFPKSSTNIVTDNLCLFSSQSNLTSPLRTTNFVLDSNQQAMSATILRTGNISPAHSDTSIESASTCSSDEQQFRPHFPSFHYQPSRSYRERENYEQLLGLAEKLSDPNGFNSVDVEQFFSYRYKAKTTTDILSSKQTACVICMSHFKNNQRIRVLPCQHEYHSKCIAQWFTMNSSCPICRRDSFLSTCWGRRRYVTVRGWRILHVRSFMYNSKNVLYHS